MMISTAAGVAQGGGCAQACGWGSPCESADLGCPAYGETHDRT